MMSFQSIIVTFMTEKFFQFNALLQVSREEREQDGTSLG